MSRTTRDDGSAAVEFALVFPILLLLISAIIDFGRMYYTQAALSGAAREGVRLVALNNNTGDDVASDVNSAIADMSGVKIDVYADGASTPVTIEDNGVAQGATIPTCTATLPVKVVVTTTFTFWTPLPNLFGVFGGQHPIAGEGVMPCNG